MSQDDENDTIWRWLVPVILMVMIVAGLVFGCIPHPSRAAEPTPAPVPTPVQDPGATVGFSAVAVIGALLIVGGFFALMYLNMKKHSGE